MNYKKYIGAILTGSMLFVSCDSYLDIEPKGRTQLTTTADYLGLLEELSPSYDHANSWNMCDEASWYRMSELELYTNPLRSGGLFLG